MPTGVYRDRVKPEFRKFIQSLDMRAWESQNDVEKRRGISRHLTDLPGKLEAEFTQPWMFVRTASQRPVVLAL